MTEPTGRTIICSVAFFDIVRYSEAHDAHQLTMKARLNDAIAQAVSGISEQERVILDTGDGAAICFLGDPEDALFVATAVSDNLRKRSSEGTVHLRSGINLGPIKLVIDLNGNTNVVGDGINVAQRVMSFADDGEILASRSYYEVVARLREGNEHLFRYMGSKRDKHVREHQLYAFGLQGTPCAAARPPIEAQPTTSLLSGQEPEAGGTGVAARAVAQALPAAVIAKRVADLTPERIAAEEHRLARHIGPLAKVIARRAAETATSAEAYVEALAAVIPDAADRADFSAAAPSWARATKSDASTPAPPAADPSSAAPPAAVASPEPAALAAADIEAAERHLAARLGPLAAILVKRAAAQARDRSDFHTRLAASVTNETERAAFLTAVDTGD